MNKWIFGLLLLISCTNKRSADLSPKQQQALLDSLLKVQLQEISAREKEVLKDRLSIEVRENLDSIIKAQSKSSLSNLPKPMVSDSISMTDSSLFYIDSSSVKP